MANFSMKCLDCRWTLVGTRRLEDLVMASRVSQMLSKDRNRLDIVKRGDLRLSLTSIEPNINKLAEKNRPLGSH
ncbi:hypothetical protein QYM36_014959 [Artemia franciscana]|uniref:Uncharacterized protein n=1 Tax=Artemia franciscana TaxID=6661 RepID=A0AA88H8Z3_ARTSF|nr:hypothetical protein QYM36_014959 [Artemia franciscana]